MHLLQTMYNGSGDGVFLFECFRGLVSVDVNTHRLMLMEYNVSGDVAFCVKDSSDVHRRMKKHGAECRSNTTCPETVPFRVKDSADLNGADENS